MKDNGNILLVANWESSVGYAWWLMENFWVAISRHFDKQGISCHLAYPEITVIPESIRASNITAHELDIRDRNRRNLTRIRQFIRDNSIRYLYLSDSPSYDPVYLLFRLWGVRKIVVHDHTPGERTKPGGIRKIAKMTVQRLPFITADHFVAVTDYVHERFLETSRIPAGKCSVAPNGIHPIDLDRAEPAYAQQTFAIPADRIIVVTTGRASSYKGIDFFITCAHELINVRGETRLHFLFCGDGPDMEKFRKQAGESEINDHFTFGGKRSDVRDILPSCDIGFHCSRGEVGYSLSILEYMSAGLATIVPDRPSMSGATRHGVTGLLYDPVNIKSACDAITACMAPDLRQRLSGNAVAEVKNCFNIENTNHRLISSLERVFSLDDSL